MIRTTQFLRVFGVLLLFSTTASAQPTRSRLGEVQLKNGVVPIYVQGQQQPAAVIRLERTLKDFQTRGFFRIGVLPMVVADGVVIEFRNPAAVAETLARAHAWLKSPGGGRSVELRRVVFLMPEGAGTNRLAAGLVRFGGAGQWQLSAGVSWQTGAGEGHLESALLQVTGPQSGRLSSAESALPDFFNTTAQRNLPNPELSPSTQGNQKESP